MLYTGVCDCCDGSDEIGSPWAVTCPNTCHDELKHLQSAAINEYRIIQSGLRKKQEYIASYQSSILSQKKSLETLKSDKKELSDYSFTMRYLYEKWEDPVERFLRFQLVRDRQIRCYSSLGWDVSESSNVPDIKDELGTNKKSIVQRYIGSCELFYSGYISSNEFLEYNSMATYAKPISRIIYEHTQAEISHMNGLTGLDRVKGSLCLAEHLLPDDNPNIFITVGDYVNFASGPKGMFNIKFPVCIFSSLLVILMTVHTSNARVVK